MGRIVFAWELGSGLGHIQRILPLASELLSRGHEVVCVMKNVVEAEKFLNEYCSNILEAPVGQIPKNPLPDTVNYAETLFNRGYLNHGNLLNMVKAWRQIFESTAPNLIIADHSPTALIAARGTKIKIIFYGTGFELPPRQSPMPSLIPWVNIPVKLMKYSEERCLQAINTVLTQLEAPLLNDLKDLFDVDVDILATFQELDHYQTREPTKYWGLIQSMLPGEQPAWPNNIRGKRIFAYLKPSYPDFDQILHDLQQIDAAIIVYTPNLSKKQKDKFQTAKLHFAAKPLDIHRVCRDSDLILCHAGHGTVSIALLHGKPLVLLPENRQLEQILTAQNVLKLNAGKVIYATDKIKDYRSVIEQTMTDAQFSRHSLNFAKKYNNFNPVTQIKKIADLTEDLLGDRNLVK